MFPPFLPVNCCVFVTTLVEEEMVETEGWNFVRILLHFCDEFTLFYQESMLPVSYLEWGIGDSGYNFVRLCWKRHHSDAVLVFSSIHCQHFGKIVRLRDRIYGFKQLTNTKNLEFPSHHTMMKNVTKLACWWWDLFKKI